jgi:hypothetical protein
MPDASKQTAQMGAKWVPGTRCGARSDASKQGPKSVPGTRCGASPDASKQGAPNRCQAPGEEPGRMLANRELKSVPGTRCGASPDASKQGPEIGAEIGARHLVRRPVGC